MNELQARQQIVAAFGGTGPIGNEKQFWTTLLTAINGSALTANDEHEFWTKLATAITNYNPADDLPATQTIVDNGEVLTGTGGTFTAVVAGGVVTGGTWTPA